MQINYDWFRSTSLQINFRDPLPEQINIEFHLFGLIWFLAKQKNVRHKYLDLV